MKNIIRLKGIEVNERKVTYTYEVCGDIKKYFAFLEQYTAEYDIFIGNIPESVLTVSFVGMMFGVALLFDATIEVETLDRDFYESIPVLVEGYRDMYSNRELGCKIKAATICENKLREDTLRALLFYGGGIDSAYSLICNMKANEIVLFQMWGADIPYDNRIAWENAKTVTEAVADAFEIDRHYGRSPFHKIFQEGLLDAYVEEKFHENFWHGFQHSIGMLSQGAPIAYIMNCKVCLFAATFSKDMDAKAYTCASDPRIDNYVRFFGLSVQHDGFDASRQKKVHTIGRYIQINKKFPIRVCYLSTDGKNCCECEKCTRSAAAFWAEKVDPRLVGINYSIEKLAEKLNQAASEAASSPAELLYRDIQSTFRNNYEKGEVPEGLFGFYTLEFEEYMKIAGAGDVWRKRYKKLKSWTDQLQAAKDWLERQNMEQKAWIDELQCSKDWLESRCNELQHWTEELEQGKKWLEEQYRQYIEHK